MKKAKRFSSRRDILLAIDDAATGIKVSLKVAEDYDAEALRWRDWFTAHSDADSEAEKEQWHSTYERMKFCKEEAERRRQAVVRHERQLRALKASLAEFNTAPMPFLADASVQAH